LKYTPKLTQKIRPVEAQLFHANGQTDRHDDAVAFRNFAKAPEKTGVIY
jgi:hypothetical protein